MIIGLDIGYGVTKVIDSSGRIDYFRSIVGAGTPRSLGLEQKKLRTVTLYGSKYTIGEDAERFGLPLINVRHRNSIEGVAYKALALSAIGDSVIKETELYIVTGLPVKFVNEDVERLKKIYQGLIPHAQLAVVPQPAGSFFDALLDMNGFIQNKDLLKGRVGVIDIGTYTTDIMLFDSMDAVDGMSETVAIGINTLLKEVAEACKGIRRGITETEAEEAIRTGYIKKHASKIDISLTVNDLKRVVSTDIWSYINSIWGSDERIEHIILTGGGASIFSDHFTPPGVTVSRLSFMSNVTGFFKMGKRLFGHGH